VCQKPRHVATASFVSVCRAADNPVCRRVVTRFADLISTYGERFGERPLNEQLVIDDEDAHVLRTIQTNGNNSAVMAIHVWLDRNEPRIEPATAIRQAAVQGVLHLVAKG
jgi:hypothetical protein